MDTCVTDIGFGSIRQTLRNIEHHLLDSMSPGEHPLRVGLKPGINISLQSHHINTQMESISRELALKPWIYYISHTQRYGLKGTLARGMARLGKAPTTALLYPTIGLWTADIRTGGRVWCRTIRRRTIRRRQHPQLSHWSSGGVFPTITHVGRVSLILTRGVSSSHRTKLNIGWPVQTGRTIHFDNKSHKYPSPDIITNPSTG